MNWLLRLFSRQESTPKETETRFQTFILEPILTPSALIDGGEDMPDPTVLDGNDLPWLDTLDAIAPEDVVSSEPFTSGTLRTRERAQVLRLKTGKKKAS